ncbi:MAG: NTP transferase domain-containing protein [Desulfotomaculales bacterium]
MVACLVLAGSKNTGPLAAASDAPYEALIPIGDRPMVGYVVDALLAAEGAGHIVVAGPRELARVLPPGVEVTPGGDTLIESLGRGLKALACEERVLVVTGDVPFLTGAAVDEFLSACGDQAADIYYTVARREDVEGRFPGMKRTYVRLRDGRFTGGNLVLLNPAVYGRIRQKAEEMARLRKRPLRLALLLGPFFILRYLAGTVSLADAERKVTALAGITGRVVVSRLPEVAVDVDKPGDLEMARALLAKTAG